VSIGEEIFGQLEGTGEVLLDHGVGETEEELCIAAKFGLGRGRGGEFSEIGRDLEVIARRSADGLNTFPPGGAQ
jgi:hypothetical protein